MSEGKDDIQRCYASKNDFVPWLVQDYCFEKKAGIYATRRLCQTLCFHIHLPEFRVEKRFRDMVGARLVRISRPRYLLLQMKCIFLGAKLTIYK